MDEQELTERTEQLKQEVRAMGINLDRKPGFFSAEDPVLNRIIAERAKQAENENV